MRGTLLLLRHSSSGAVRPCSEVPVTDSTQCQIIPSSDWKKKKVSLSRSSPGLRSLGHTCFKTFWKQKQRRSFFIGLQIVHPRFVEEATPPTQKLCGNTAVANKSQPHESTARQSNNLHPTLVRQKIMRAITNYTANLYCRLHKLK